MWRDAWALLGHGHFLNFDGDFRANDASPGHRTNGIWKRRPKSSFTQKNWAGLRRTGVLSLLRLRSWPLAAWLRYKVKVDIKKCNAWKSKDTLYIFVKNIYKVRLGILHFSALTYCNEFCQHFYKVGLFSINILAKNVTFENLSHRRTDRRTDGQTEKPIY